MANSYKTDIIAVATTGSDVDFFTSPTGGCIVRDVMIYAKTASTTVSVLYDDRTDDAQIATETSMASGDTWRPFATPIGMQPTHKLSVNTNEAVNVLITYVEFD